jgi:hypothetical protein
VNLCCTCGLDFTGLRDFDSHRRGKYPQSGPSEYLDRLRDGLIEPDEHDPRRDDHGRRCLEADELAAAGWVQDRFGRWSHPRRVHGDAPAGRHSRLRSAA